MDALVQGRPSVTAASTSLLTLGYNHVGLDDCWQACTGPKGTFHDASSGQPLVNTMLFPSLRAMVEHGHRLGVQVGFYGNNCRCKECTSGSSATWTCSNPTRYRQDANLTTALAFDGIKVDSCGQDRNMSAWAAQFHGAGKELFVESCGNGPKGTNPKKDSPPKTAFLSMVADSCPFSIFRVSQDIAPQWFSAIYNANRALPYLGRHNALSRPGCWAYPDVRACVC